MLQPASRSALSGFAAATNSSPPQQNKMRMRPLRVNAKEWLQVCGYTRGEGFGHVADYPEQSQEFEVANVRLAYGRGFELLRENLAVASALAITVGITLSTFFLFSYLSVFDWHLIWFVQYVDVISFGIVAVGLIGGSITVLNPLVYMWFNARKLESGSRKRWTIAAAIVILLFVALEIRGAVSQHQGYFHVISGVALVGAVILMIFATLSHLRAGTWPTLSQAASLSLLVLLITFGFGRWIADLVLESTVFDQDIRVRDQVMDNSKLVIVLSRFTILLKDNELRVVPTADISEFHSAHKLTIVP